MNEDKSTRYHRLQRTTIWLSLGVRGVGMTLLLLGGWAILLRDEIVRLTGFASTSLPAAVLFAGLLLLLAEAATLPFTFYRSFLLERRFGLSSVPLRTWAIDHLKGFGLSAALGIAATAIVYAALTRWPRWWWAASALAFVVAMVLLARIAPAVLLPMFFRFKPLDRATLRSRLEDLSTRAGLPVLGIYEWGLGEKTQRANAALVGTGRSRRILLSDTLLADYTEDEIEVIIAHELGHHAHSDIRNGLLMESLLIVIGFAAAAIGLAVAWQPLGLHAPNDAAGLPLLLLAAALVSMSTKPLVNAVSRRNEHRADRFALTMTERPDAFVSAMRRLAAQNLAEARPSTATLWLFHTHPPFEQRIQAARTFTS